MADAIMEGLLEYADMATEDMKVDVKKAAKTVKKDIQAGAPVKSGAYGKSWAVNPISPLHTARLVHPGLGLTIGMIIHMYAESRNDEYTYATVATQEDFDCF